MIALALASQVFSGLIAVYIPPNADIGDIFPNTPLAHLP